MTENELITHLQALVDVDVVTAAEGDGSPEVAWGDSFVYCRPANEEPTDENRFRPFATIVTKDYDGFDVASDLNREGVFRVNIAVGRERFEDLLGYPPAEVKRRGANIDFAAFDRLLPHPQYAAQGWVSIVNPSRLDEQLKTLLHEAHARAARRDAE